MTCSGTHKSRLFIGEAEFKGVLSLLEKHAQSHPNLGKSVIATELMTFGRTSDYCPNCEEKEEMNLASSIANLFLQDHQQSHEAPSFFCSDRCERIDVLQKKGVTIILGFDGTKIHESTHPSITGRKFKRIQWNCPHDGSNYLAQTLPPIIKSFFSSASQMQNPGDRIHISIPQPIVPFDKRDFFQGYVYNLRNTASINGYRLFAKRPGPERYPGYTHKTTIHHGHAPSAENQREFVFVKDPYTFPAGRAVSLYKRKTFYSRRPYEATREFYVRDTDNESSSYSSEGSSEEEN